MKFQNCILINFERTHGWTDKPKAICPFNFSKVGGIIKEEMFFEAIVDNRRRLMPDAGHPTITIAHLETKAQESE